MNVIKLANLFLPAVFLVSSEIWVRIVIQGFEQGLLSLALESSIRCVKNGAWKLSPIFMRRPTSAFLVPPVANASIARTQNKTCGV